MLCSNEDAWDTMLREQGGLHTILPAFCVSESFASAQGAAVQISIMDALQQ